MEQRGGQGVSVIGVGPSLHAARIQRTPPRGVQLTKGTKGEGAEGQKSLMAYDLPKLNQDDKKNLNSYVARKQIETVTKENSNQMTLGPDGLLWSSNGPLKKLSMLL